VEEFHDTRDVITRPKKDLIRNTTRCPIEASLRTISIYRKIGNINYLPRKVRDWLCGSDRAEIDLLEIVPSILKFSRCSGSRKSSHPREQELKKIFTQEPVTTFTRELITIRFTRFASESIVISSCSINFKSFKSTSAPIDRAPSSASKNTRSKKNRENVQCRIDGALAVAHRCTVYHRLYERTTNTPVHTPIN